MARISTSRKKTIPFDEAALICRNHFDMENDNHIIGPDGEVYLLLPIKCVTEDCDTKRFVWNEEIEECVTLILGESYEFVEKTKSEIIYRQIIDEGAEK